MTDRRTLLTFAASTPLLWACSSGPAEAAQKYEFTLSDAEWRKRLSAEEALHRKVR